MRWRRRTHRDDGTLSFEDWMVASERLLDALTRIDAAAFQLFYARAFGDPFLIFVPAQHDAYVDFELIRQRYASDWWPALRSYDIATRRAHTLRSTNDLQEFDLHRFADILLERGVPLPPSTLSSLPLRHPATIYGSRRYIAPRAHEPSAALSTRLDLFLETLKPGLGSQDVMCALRTLGITSPRHLADLATLGDDTLNEVFSHPCTLTPYQRVMLRELLRRRFETSELHDRSV